MSSSEEYLENLLQSMYAKDDVKSSAQKEPEQDGAIEESEEFDSGEINDMLASMETDAISEDGLTDDIIGSEDGLESGADMIGQDDLGLMDLALEEPDMDDDLSAIDDLSLDDMLIDEPGLDGIAVEEAGLDDMAASDDFSLDDMLIDEPEPDDTSVSDDFSLNDMLIDEPELDDTSVSDDFSLDDMMLEESDGMALEDTGLDDMSGLDELNLDDMDLNESGVDDMMSLDELSLDDMALDESDLGEISDSFAVEDSGMDDSLDEISDLLEQSEQDEGLDDEMLALLESVSGSESNDTDEADFDLFPNGGEDNEGTDLSELMSDLEETQEAVPEEKKKKERKKRGKKAKGSEADAELQEGQGGEGASDDALADEETEADKKPGVFARFLAFLTESDDDEEDSEGAMTGELTDENKELLAELSAEDKKDKKDKKKKKDKKGKKKASSDTEGDEEGAEEGGKSAKKKKKPKKEKKEKEAEIDSEIPEETPGKKLSKKNLTTVAITCATITIVIIALTSLVPDYLQKRDARVAYDMGNYEEAFELFYGKSLDEGDEAILHKSTLVMTMNRKLASYRNYQKLDNGELQALDALIQGVDLYWELLPEAEQYYVTEEIREIYQELLDILYSQYGVSETDALEILGSEDDIMYTKRLTSIVYGISFEDGNAEDVQPESGIMEDILPEEQEIIDGLPEEISDIFFEGEAAVEDIEDTEAID